MKKLFNKLKQNPILRHLGFALHNTFPDLWARTRVTITASKRSPTLIPVQVKNSDDSNFTLWIDYSASSKVPFVTGIQRVVHNIVAELKQVNLNQIVLNNDELQNHDVLLMLDSSWLSILEGNFDTIFKKFHKTGATILTVIYDLNPIDFPNYFSKDFVAIFKCWLARAIKESDGFICISKTTAERFRLYLENNCHKYRKYYNDHNNIPIKYWRLGSSISILNHQNNQKNSTEKLDFFSDPITTFITVGTLEPRKGHELILDAFELLWQKGYKIRLCIAGKYGWMMQDLVQRIKTHPENGARLIYLDQPTDAELVYCYQKSQALVIASEAEGFGLPIVEASQFGIPIFASDIEVFQEIGQGHISYFKVGDVRSLQGLIERWLIDDNKNQWPDSRQIKRLTWAESAAELLSIIRDCNPVPGFPLKCNQN